MSSVQSIGIVGLGLIGGSVGLALRDPSRRILGYDPSPEATKLAKTRFCIDAEASLDEVAQCEVVFIASPPATLIEALDQIEPLRGENTVVTDCASVKGDAIEWANRKKATWFVPGHPMAGHEKTSAAYASAWMFRNARWLLTPSRHTANKALRLVEGVVSLMGATPIRLDAASHDRQVAILSHLPHVFAASLVLQGQELERTDVSGGSWRDLTRVGGVDPELWSQILIGNRRELVGVLAESERIIQQFRAALEENDADKVRALMESACTAKERQETK